MIKKMWLMMLRVAVAVVHAISPVPADKVSHDTVRTELAIRKADRVIKMLSAEAKAHKPR